MKLQKIVYFALSCLCSFPIFAEGALCQDPGILDLTDRGSVTDTPCTVPKKDILIEGGYQLQTLIPNNTLSNYPQTQLVFGLPGRTELFADAPNYNIQTNPDLLGFSAVSLGAKTLFFSGESYAIAGQGIITIPGGSHNFGSPGTGYTANAIGTYKLSRLFSIASMVGGSSTTEPSVAGGGRFNSFNYSASLGFAPIEQLSFFGELFGQTKTSPDTNDGLDGDFGLLYAVAENVSLDAEYANRINGDIGGYRNYVGAGVTAVFG